MKRIAVLVFLALLACPQAGLSASKPDVAKSTKASPTAPAADSVPTKITSEKMLYSHTDQSVTFEGSVFVDRTDFQLWAKRITVFFAGQPGSGQAGPTEAKAKGGSDPDLQAQAGNIDRIEAQGDVRMKRETRIGICEKAVYHAKEGMVVMSGNPVLTDGPNKIQGEVIRFWLKDNRSEVVGGPSGRVEAIFFTPKGAKAP